MFVVKVPAISKHLKNIFETGELNRDSTISILETIPLLGRFVKFIPALFIGKFTVPLKVGKKSQQKILDKKWKIIVNTEIEIDE